MFRKLKLKKSESRGAWVQLMVEKFSRRIAMKGGVVERERLREGVERQRS